MSLWESFLEKPDNVENALRERTAELKKQSLWRGAFIARVNVYYENDIIYGSYPLANDTKTVLPLTPSKTTEAETFTVTDWRISLVSMEHQRVIGELPYAKGLQVLRDFALDIKAEGILIRPLSLEDFATILNRFDNLE